MSSPIFSKIPVFLDRDFFLLFTTFAPSINPCIRMTRLSLPIFIAFLFGISSPLPARPLQNDTLKTTKITFDSTRVFYFHNNFDRLGRLDINVADTSIFHTISYNAVTINSPLSATLGNTGSASHSLIPQPVSPETGFDFGIHSFDNWLFQNDSVKYYKVLKTYSDIHYVQGANKELFFNAAFSRNIYKSLNLGFDFRALSSTGAYQRQQTNIINFVLTSQYFSPDNRYALIANMTMNRIKNQENGGIANDSLFTQNIEPNRVVIPVNLANARNRVKESGFYLKNYFTLAPSEKRSQDSLKPSRKNFNLGRIIYSFQYNRQIHDYIDANPLSGFYPDIFYDSTATNDSITINRITNELAWTNPLLNRKKEFKALQLDFRIKHQYIEVTDLEGKTYLTQWIPSGAIAFQPYYGLRLEGGISYVMGDYNEGDYNIHADLGIIPGRRHGHAGMIHFTSLYTLEEASWFYHRYHSNHFSWENSFNKTGVFAISAFYDHPYFNAGATTSRINKLVYLDTGACPAQLDKEITWFHAWVKGNLPVWRFNFSGEIAYQQVDGTEALSVPDFAGNMSITFTQPVFQGHATIQPGFNFFYNTSYYSNNYMPATRSFYLQSDKKTGDYLYMDVFLNVKIQRARLFAMYSHFNAGWMGRNYLMVNGYPMPDAAFRFGLSWRFHD